ncbi:NifB/NifX family molybdenum-iron cluster-binding protein [Pyrobaculum aerophilum]|mgnify:CR=1 FL=1|uniref:NifB/NifX family molybdenum-iron cluster-binding protein n=1 Tax=Pyrobaculum aerophilum TaxID=13773 RepID=UPI002FD89147
MKIAIACDLEGNVFPGHFAHAPKFRIYQYENGQLRLLEERENPLGSLPDYDEHHGHEITRLNADFQGEEMPPAHGLPKYSWLRSKVLPDVDVIIAGGACQTSYRYFTSQGVKMLFTEPVEVSALEEYIASDPVSFEEALRQAE